MTSRRRGRRYRRHLCCVEATLNLPAQRQSRSAIAAAFAEAAWTLSLFLSLPQFSLREEVGNSVSKVGQQASRKSTRAITRIQAELKLKLRDDVEGSAEQEQGRSLLLLTIIPSSFGFDQSKGRRRLFDKSFTIHVTSYMLILHPSISSEYKCCWLRSTGTLPPLKLDITACRPSF